MITLLLDTNILHQEGLASGNMLLLKRLIDVNHVEIFIPELVKKEYLTRRVMESKEKLKEAQNSLLTVAKKVSKNSETQTKINEVKSCIKDIEENIERSIYKDFAQWELDFLVNNLPFDPAVMTAVMDEYFSGGGVYRKPKSREDIPDAIINKSIEDLAAKKREITVAIKDGAFRKHLSKDQRMILVDSLEEFLTLGLNAEKLAELDALSSKTGRVLDYLSSEGFRVVLLAYLAKAGDEVGSIYLEEEDITIVDQLEVDTFAERINFPQANTVRELVVESVSHLTSTSYSLKISFHAQATLNYCAYYQHYMLIETDKSREVSIDSMNGEGICDLSELFAFRFHGHIEFKFQEDLDVAAIETHSQDLGSDKNPIALSINIDKAEIVNI